MSSTIQFPIAIKIDPKDGSCGVVVPDLPGCFSAGKSIDDAIAKSHEAILLHLEGMLEDGTPVPKPKPIALRQRGRAFRGWVWAVIAVDLADVSQVQRVNISLPASMLRAIDRHAEDTGDTRSGLLLKAAAKILHAKRSA
jgi:predicted RNase H-like HicB family nuclease